MANANTIVGYLAGTGVNQIPLMSLSQTASTSLNFVPVSNASGTTAAIINVPLQGDITGSSVPLSYNQNSSQAVNNRGRVGQVQPGTPGYNTASFDGHPFRVRCITKFSVSTSATTSQISLGLYQGVNSTTTSTLSTSGTQVLATGGGAGCFLLTADLLWDSVSQILGGSCGYTFTFGGVSTIVASTSISTTTVTTPGNLSFLAGVKFATATVGGVTIQGTEFVIEEV